MTITQLVAVLTWFCVTFSRGTTTAIFINLPATLMHELSHWVVALLTGSRPGFPSIWPRREGNKWLLGSVEFLIKPHVAGAIALAPLWCLAPVTWYLVTAPADPADSLLYQGMWGLLAGFLAVGAVPSSQDWYIALKYPLSSLVVLAAIVGATHLAINP